MTPERWQQVKSTLAGALDQENTRERAAFLGHACADDTALRREVQSLLDQPPDEFEAVAERIGVANPEPFSPATSGRRIGAYELIRELGRGGMGTVWLARRADQHFEKLVAIKLLKRGTDTDEVLNRFHAERRILARLDHPNIARLLDAGTTEDHLPYFVMEYVEGARLTDFAWANNLSLGERLRLFLKICHAVQFAHQNLVVHRDLKPGNILVTQDCEPKLLDFGVAKLLAPGDDAWQMTIAGRERFTPGYASPEQVRGEPITTVSDVYSLGALLYELLTGIAPHRFPTKTPTAAQLERVVCDEEPLRPSVATKQPEARRSLRGDLDTIVLRALAKDPARRYRSAGHLADDLRRYLEHRPVRARPDKLTYRAGKFVRRNKLVVGATVLLLSSLVSGVIATARQAQIANRERARAERRFNEVRKIANSFMLEFHSLIADLPGAMRARQYVTQRAVDYLDSLAEEAGNDVSLKAELAQAYQKIGQVTFDARQALIVREKAARLNESVVAAAPAKSAYQLQLSDSYAEYADALKINGRSSDAIDYARRALAVAEKAAAVAPGDLATRAVVAERHLIVGIALDDAGDFNAAREAFAATLPLAEALVAEDRGAKPLRDLLVNASGKLSATSIEAGDLDVASAYSAKELALAEEMLAEEPLNARHRRSMWAALYRRGRLFMAAGETERAFEDLQRATRFLEELAAADPQDRGHRRWLALTYAASANVLAATERTGHAYEQLQRALSISEELVREDPERAEARRDTAQMLTTMGGLLLDEGKVDGALEPLRRAESLTQALMDRDPQNARLRSGMATIYGEIARCHRRSAENSPLQREARLRDALAFAQRSLVLWQEVSDRGLLTHADAQKPEATARLATECEAALGSTPPRA